jgi:hypothetical protein
MEREEGGNPIKKSDKDKKEPSTCDGKTQKEIQQEAYDVIHKARFELLSKLKTCIDNEYPFLLITSKSKSLTTEDLEVVSSVSSKDMSRILISVFINLPFETARAILHELSDTMIFSVVDTYLEMKLEEEGWSHEQ